MGIDESLYGGVKSALLWRIPLSSLDEAYNVLTQDEEAKSLARMHEEAKSLKQGQQLSTKVDLVQ